MTDKTLPTEVVRKDRTLQKAGDDLAKLRWHWTLDATNPDRVSFTEYGRQVGAARPTISTMANGYVTWLALDRSRTATPGEPQTVDDCVQLAKMGAERQTATKALAKATGKTVSNVASNKHQDVDDVLAVARERALDKGTTVEHEIEKQADSHAKWATTRAKDKADHTAAHTMRFIEIEGHVGVAMQRLRKILTVSEDVAFTDDERELLTDSLGKLRALLSLIDLRITGEVDIDWDAAMEKLEAR